MATLKFNLESFKELDAPDLIINVWSYSDFLKTHQNCCICKKYRDYSIKALKEKWEVEWGNFDHIMNKFKKNDRNFINISKYSSVTRHLIIDFLTKIEENKKNL